VLLYSGPALCFTDYNGPNTSGLSVSKTIRKHVRFRDAICAVTGHLIMSKQLSPEIHNGEDEPGIGVNHPVPTLQISGFDQFG